MLFQAGYKFKETHEEIHYIRKSHGKPGDNYSDNFTTDPAEGALYDSDSEAESAIMRMMTTFKRDTDYRWTPVICDLAENTTRMIISCKWH